MDLLYIVKESEENEELRYSIRSAVENFKVRNIVITGYTPSWLKNVISIPVIQDHRLKYQNSTNNLKVACQSKQLSKEFVLMNDDFFILKPIDAIPTYHRGPTTDVIAEYRAKQSGLYGSGMRATDRLIRRFLKGQAPLSYELHVPMVMMKHRVLRMLELPDQYKQPISVLHKRTLYGNYYQIGGEQIHDVKLNKNNIFDYDHLTFISTDDYIFKYGAVGEDIRRRFPNKSQYEV